MLSRILGETTRSTFLRWPTHTTFSRTRSLLFQAIPKIHPRLCLFRRTLHNGHSHNGTLLALPRTSTPTNGTSNDSTGDTQLSGYPEATICACPFLLAHTSNITTQ